MLSLVLHLPEELPLAPLGVQAHWREILSIFFSLKMSSFHFYSGMLVCLYIKFWVDRDFFLFFPSAL